jgi:hypothetical protein
MTVFWQNPSVPLRIADEQVRIDLSLKRWENTVGHIEGILKDSNKPFFTIISHIIYSYFS